MEAIRTLPRLSLIRNVNYNLFFSKAALALLLALTCCNSPPKCSGAQTPKLPAWKVEILMPSSLAVSDSHQNVTIALLNVGNETLWALDTNPLHDYDVVIKTVTGRVIPMTEHGKRFREGQNESFTHVRRVPVKPGESIKTSFELKQCYQLSPGDYEIDVTAKSVREDTVSVDADGHLKKKMCFSPLFLSALACSHKDLIAAGE